MRQIDPSEAKDWEKEDFEFNVKYLLTRGRNAEALAACQKRFGKEKGGEYFEAASRPTAGVPTLPQVDGGLVPSDQFDLGGDTETDNAAFDDFDLNEANVDAIKDWVGGDADRAQEAYDAEMRRGSQRKSLVEWLEDNFEFEE